jgi:cell division protein FtsQ
MSREGKRRSALRGLRLAGGLAALAISAAAAWEVVMVLKPTVSAPSLPAARTLPIGDNLEVVTDGVLDKAWLRRTLALPPTATLANIDPAALRLRVLTGGQVLAAELIRHFPSTLSVHLAERTPVARLMADSGQGAPQEYLVARDGVVFAGQGFDPAMVKTLPWLDGVRPVPGGPGRAMIAGMDETAEFLARCSLDAQQLYRTWQVVSLARLASDGLIEVRNAAGTRIVFRPKDENLYSQLARLDTVLDTVAGAVPADKVKKIDLSFPDRAVVAIDQPPSPAPTTAAGRKAAKLSPSASASPAPPPLPASALQFKIYP